MTCIVGMVSDGIVYLGADSLGGNSTRYDIYKTPKLVKVTLRVEGQSNIQAVIGYTTSYRMGDLLRRIDVPALSNANKKFDINTFLIDEFIPKLRETFKEGGFSRVENNVETGGCFLLGVAGRLFSIQGDYCVLESEKPYTAEGSGMDHAMGAMCAMTRLQGDWPAQKVLEAGLIAAESHVPTVRRPFHFISTKD